MVKADKKEESEKTIPVYNRGSRTYNTSKGNLAGGKTLHLPEAEANNLLGYDDLLDGRKIVEPEDLAKIKAERDALKSENEKLQKENESLRKKLDE